MFLITAVTKLRAGQSGERNLSFLQNAQTVSGTHPPFSVGTEGFLHG